MKGCSPSWLERRLPQPQTMAAASSRLRVCSPSWLGHPSKPSRKRLVQHEERLFYLPCQQDLHTIRCVEGGTRSQRLHLHTGTSARSFVEVVAPELAGGAGLTVVVLSRYASCQAPSALVLKPLFRATLVIPLDTALPCHQYRISLLHSTWWLQRRQRVHPSK